MAVRYNDGGSCGTSPSGRRVGPSCPSPSSYPLRWGASVAPRSCALPRARCTFCPQSPNWTGHTPLYSSCAARAVGVVRTPGHRAECPVLHRAHFTWSHVFEEGARRGVLEHTEQVFGPLRVILRRGFSRCCPGARSPDAVGPVRVEFYKGEGPCMPSLADCQGEVFVVRRCGGASPGGPSTGVRLLPPARSVARSRWAPLGT